MSSAYLAELRAAMTASASMASCALSACLTRRSLAAKGGLASAPPDCAYALMPVQNMGLGIWKQTGARVVMCGKQGCTSKGSVPEACQ